ncbi:MFS transporter [Bartonella machadoae]|uniref:MFS transporter n=1 Tax=Bartonella machadoae TaxID=2893471 RepID=UPI001F4D0D22|nr:MFS transporter [Bartonella machadoae]UNE53572.1 MFS transporter [Bartonella machadoae]
MLRTLFHFKASTQLILITSLFSSIGIFMVVPFLAIYLNKLNSLTTTEVGIIIDIAFWCKKAGSLLGGILSDYVHVKKTMLSGLAIRIPGYLIIGFTDNFYILLFSCILIGLGSSIYVPAAKSFLVRNVSIAQKVEALATRSIFNNIGVSIGPVIGMLIFKMVPSLLFSFVGLIFFLLFLLNCALKESFDSKTLDKINFSDFRKLLTNKTMLSVAFFMFMFTFFYIQLESIIPLFSDQVFGGNAAPFIFILNALIVIFFQLPLSKWACKESSKKPFILSFVFLDSHLSCSTLLIILISTSSYQSSCFPLLKLLSIYALIMTPQISINA